MAGTQPTPRALAVYGLALTGLDDLGPVTPPPPASWPRWSVERVAREDPAPEPGMSVWTDRARIGLPEGELRIDRQARRIVFDLRRPLAPEAILHPALVPAAAIVAAWDGRASIHASAVLVDGAVWGLLADRGGGKSTTAALLAQAGAALIADDMLVLDGATCFAGPPAVDLREDAAATMGGVPLGMVGTRERWRRPFSITVLEAPLAGWVELTWADEVAVTLADASRRIDVLGHHASLPLAGAHLLELADRPMLRLERPRSIDGARLVAAALLDAISAHGRPRAGMAAARS